MNVVLSGGIGAGKSTAVMAALQQSGVAQIRGLMTRFDVSDPACRVLTVSPWNGPGRVCARKRASGSAACGSFDVDLSVFNTFATCILEQAASADIVVLDELGLFEQPAMRFVDAVISLWTRHGRVLTVVQQRALPFWLPHLDAAAPGTKLVLTARNRNQMPSLICAALLTADR